MKSKSRERKNKKGGRRQKGAMEHAIDSPPGKIEPPSAYVRIFERLFRSFRMHAFEQFGDSYGEAIARAEKKISLLTPEFDLQALTDETAPLIVDVVEEIVRNASFFKRPKLRRTAIAIIADLYNKQYQILEERGAIERIEQVYYRLKN